MNQPLKTRIQIFDPKQDFTVVERRLPHWTQAGTVSFVTWRTWDSIPAAVLKLWLAQRDAWLREHGIDRDMPNWRGELFKLPAEQVLEFQLSISDRWNDHLDACHGECALRRVEFAQEVANSLIRFDGDRYDLTDFVVMPNHVHLLVAFPDEQSMLIQCESWKHYTAMKINRALGRKGRFWQQDGFDHLVRSLDHFQYYRDYIADNSKRAHLRKSQYVHHSKRV